MLLNKHACGKCTLPFICIHTCSVNSSDAVGLNKLQLLIVKKSPKKGCAMNSKIPLSDKCNESYFTEKFKREFQKSKGERLP